MLAKKGGIKLLCCVYCNINPVLCRAMWWIWRNQRKYEQLCPKYDKSILKEKHIRANLTRQQKLPSAWQNTHPQLTVWSYIIHRPSEYGLGTEIGWHKQQLRLRFSYRNGTEHRALKLFETNKKGKNPSWLFHL